MLKRVFFIFLVTLVVQASAQRTNSSPYSFFGIGEEFNPKTVEQVSMGGIGVAFVSPHYLNFTNPAAYANLRYTTYSFGLLNNDLTIKDNLTSQSSTATNLSYYALAFPIGKKAGASFGMQPVSSVGYSLKNDEYDDNGEEIAFTLFNGRGGVNRVYGSFGMTLTKGLTLGIEGDFMYGTILNNIFNQRDEVVLITSYDKSARVRGASLKIGTQYQKTFKNDLNLSAGIAVKLATSLSARGNEYIYSLSIGATGTLIPRDTLSASTISSTFVIPKKTTIGLGLGKTNRWYTGIEYESQDAINATGYLNETGAAFAYINSSRISFGGFYLPKINSISSYWERVTYRAGLRIEKRGLAVNGDPSTGVFTPIEDFGISFGLGLPLGKQLSNVNAGFEFGKRGTTDNGLIQENYFNFRLSLSLNDVWFKKRKID